MKKVWTLIFIVCLTLLISACNLQEQPNLLDESNISATWENTIFKNQWKLFNLESAEDYFASDIEWLYDYSGCLSDPIKFWWELACEKIKYDRDSLVFGQIAYYSWFKLIVLDLNKIDNKEVLNKWLLELDSDEWFITLKSILLKPELFINWAIMPIGSNLNKEFPKADKSKILFTFEWQDLYDPVISMFLLKDNYLIWIYSYQYLDDLNGQRLLEYENIRWWWENGIFDYNYYKNIFNSDENFKNLVLNTIDTAYQIFELN